MTWQLRYHLRRLFKSSFWLMPTLCILLAMILGNITRWLDQHLDVQWLNYSAEGARALLGSLSGSLLTFLVFVVSSMLLIVQIASSQLSPRIIALALSNKSTRFTLGLFVFTYAYSLATLSRIDDKVPQLPVMISVVGTLICIVVFFWFTQKLGSSLRPVSVLHAIGEGTRKVVDEIYPHPFVPPNERSRKKWQDSVASSTSRIIPYHSGSGVLMALAIPDLVTLAQKTDCLIELIPQVGDFLPKDEPLFRIYPAEREISEKALHQAVMVSSERTFEQDPMFGFRIIVDIAARALSPAINDPTTGVMAIDQLHRLLRYVGMRQLSDGTVCDEKQVLRVVYPTPNWEDFVSMAVSEIRSFGVTSLQIPRRLRAMLEHLLEVMPEARKPVLIEELKLLDSAVELSYPAGIMRSRAMTADRQGLGGSPVAKAKQIT